MDKEEILNKYIDLIDKGYCSDCNELNCIDNFPHTKITRAIRKLQQENKELKEDINKYKRLGYKHLQEQNNKLEERIDKAIDKLYCWGEALNPEFQKIMLDILKEVK